MAEPAQLVQKSEGSAPQKKPYQRLEGEPALWWRRFRMYRDLGFKRSLQAAFEQERTTIRVLKSTKDEEIQTRKSRKTAGPHLAQVPKTQIVPGSWKAASVKWNWVSRARAWDEYALDYLVDEYLDKALSGMSQTVVRVNSLKSMAELLATNMNENIHSLNFDQTCMIVARLQSVLRDIREEMRIFDEPLARVLLHREARTTYESMTPEEHQQKLKGK